MMMYFHALLLFLQRYKPQAPAAPTTCRFQDIFFNLRLFLISLSQYFGTVFVICIPMHFSKDISHKRWRHQYPCGLHVLRYFSFLGMSLIFIANIFCKILGTTI